MLPLLRALPWAPYLPSLGPSASYHHGTDLPSPSTQLFYTCPATPAELYVLKQAPSTLAAGLHVVSLATLHQGPAGIWLAREHLPLTLRAGNTCTMVFFQSWGTWDLGITGSWRCEAEPQPQSVEAGT